MLPLEVAVGQPDSSRATVLLDRYIESIVRSVDTSAATGDVLPDSSTGGLEVDVVSIRKVPKFARSWFIGEYDSLGWTFRGSRDLTLLDTTLTSVIRAHLEAEYGEPTEVLADRGLIHTLRQEEYVQFEYWFVVNGEIPFKVMDVNGPFERGVVASVPHSQAEKLEALREHIIGRALRNTSPAPYVDYYYEPDTATWYTAGFDGDSYFNRAINPRLMPQGRPRLKK